MSSEPPREERPIQDHPLADSETFQDHSAPDEHHEPGERPTYFPETPKEKLKHALFGAPRNLQDPRVFHSISLIAFLAWVGLGADGLSSSAYGPDESFRSLGTHTY